MTLSACAKTSHHRPTISVCLLAYNQARLLGDALESLLVQTHEDFELLISDDCSTDETPDVISRFAGRDPRVRGLRPAHNLGMPANANFAVRHARGEFIALLHHDDLCDPRLLERWLQVAHRHPRVAFVSNAFVIHGTNHVDYHMFDECTNGRRALEHNLFSSWGCPIRGTALIRKECWDAVGGMREQFGLIADVDLWMRLAARWDVGYVRSALLAVRHEPPDGYPVEYVDWTWSRLRLLYEIHGTNRREYFSNRPARALLEELRFRHRVNKNELYWLMLALAKRRWHLLAESDAVSTRYELGAVRVFREHLAGFAKRRARRSAGRRVAP